MRSSGSQRARRFQAKATVRASDERYPSMQIGDIVDSPPGHKIPPLYRMNIHSNDDKKIYGITA
jgi:hypothetical protein